MTRTDDIIPSEWWHNLEAKQTAIAFIDNWLEAMNKIWRVES